MADGGVPAKLKIIALSWRPIELPCSGYVLVLHVKHLAKVDDKARDNITIMSYLA